MNKDQAIGVALLLGGTAGILIYTWLVFLSPWALLTLQLTGFIAVTVILGIIAWIGYALATTPPPKPIEKIEKELKEELKKLEQEVNSDRQEPSELFSAK